MVSKVHVANRRQPPPPARRRSGTRGRRVTAGGGGRGRGSDGEGLGARASSPFLWNKGKSVSEASVTPGRAKAVGRVGLATRRKFVRAGTPGPGEGQPGVFRGLCASPMQGGGQHGVWAQSWGGRRGGWSPAPSFPLPLRAEFGAQSRARTLRRPRAPRVSLRGVPGKGLGTKLFPVPKWTREFSFLQSFPHPTPKHRVAGRQGSCCTHRDSGGGQSSEGALSASGFVGAP